MTALDDAYVDEARAELLRHVDTPPPPGAAEPSSARPLSPEDGALMRVAEGGALQAAASARLVTPADSERLLMSRSRRRLSEHTSDVVRAIAHEQHQERLHQHLLLKQALQQQRAANATATATATATTLTPTSSKRLRRSRSVSGTPHRQSRHGQRPRSAGTRRSRSPQRARWARSLRATRSGSNSSRGSAFSGASEASLEDQDVEDGSHTARERVSAAERERQHTVRVWRARMTYTRTCFPAWQAELMVQLATCHDAAVAIDSATADTLQEELDRLEAKHQRRQARAAAVEQARQKRRGNKRPVRGVSEPSMDAAVPRTPSKSKWRSFRGSLVKAASFATIRGRGASSTTPGGAQAMSAEEVEHRERVEAWKRERRQRIDAIGVLRESAADHAQQAAHAWSMAHELETAPSGANLPSSKDTKAAATTLVTAPSAASLRPLLHRPVPQTPSRAAQQPTNAPPAHETPLWLAWRDNNVRMWLERALHFADVPHCNLLAVSWRAVTSHNHAPQ